MVTAPAAGWYRKLLLAQARMRSSLSLTLNVTVPSGLGSAFSAEGMYSENLGSTRAASKTWKCVLKVGVFVWRRGDVCV